MNNPNDESLRRNLGYVRYYANRMNLAAMQPLPNLATSGYCLANPAGDHSQYLVYLSSGNNVTVDLSGAAGDLTVEWFNPATGMTTSGGKTTGGGLRKFTAPFSGDAVLYVYSAQDLQRIYLPITLEVSQTSLISYKSPTPLPASSDVVQQSSSDALQIYLPITINGAALPPVSNRAFLETFDGEPARPQPWSSANWDIQVQSRDINTWLTLEPMQAAHGLNCEPPPAAHDDNGDYRQAVYQCRQHVMTAINASGYGVIYLTPNQMIDFSSGEGVLRFNISTLRSSARDWVDIWITPFSENAALPLESDVDLAGAPKDALQIRMDTGNSGVFTGYVYRNYQQTTLAAATRVGYEQIFTPSAANRALFELRISRTHIRFGLPDYNLWWINTQIADLGWDAGVAQLGHHSYNPQKDCRAYSLVCLPNTWHWDNVLIDPAQPFTMIHADRRYVLKSDTAQTITFQAPAPPNAFLRFAGVGHIEVSLNGGAFQEAVKAQTSALPGTGNYHPEHMSSYWMPIPQNTQTVQFRFSNDSWYTTGYEMIAKDFAIWSPIAKP